MEMAEVEEGQEEITNPTCTSFCQCLVHNMEDLYPILKTSLFSFD